VRNLRLYGDLFGLDTFIEILGKRDVPASLGQLWRERTSFAAGYWGNFGGLNVPMPDWVYRMLDAITILAVAGLLFGAVRWLVGRFRRSGGHPAPATPHTHVVAWPFALCLLWGLGVVIPWSQWASVTWSSQGRLVFSALPVWSLLLALGLQAWSPGRWGAYVLATFALLLLCLTACAPFLWIAPAYALPEPLTGAAVDAIPNRLDVEFRASAPDGEQAEGVMRLLGYRIGSHEVDPGEPLFVTLYWEALAPTPTDHTVFVHLLGEGELLAAQRDTFPGLGLLSTTWLIPGSRWADRYVLQLPATAFTPDRAQIEVGIYETGTGARLIAAESDGQQLGDHVRFGGVAIPPVPEGLSNAARIDFGGRIALVGYHLDRRVAAPGEEIMLTLYWQGQRSMATDYTVSAQLVDAQQRKAAQLDSWPRGGGAPTSSFEPEQTVVDARPLSIYSDAAPGVYDVRVAVYRLGEGALHHLPIVPPGGRMLADHIVLTQARITPR
jgi:hypothetical protein